MSVEFKERERTVEIHRHGCLVGSWPKRVLEVSRVLDGQTVWCSRKKTAEELNRLREWLRQAMNGPPDGLVQRLIANVETPRDDSERDLTFKSRNPQSGNVGSLFTYNTTPNGRPPNPPAFDEVCTTYDVGQIELATGAVTRHGMRLLAADIAAMFDIDTAARKLSLTPSIVGELVYEHHHPRPPLGGQRRRFIGAKEYRPLETEEQRNAPALTRANRLFCLGLEDHVIADLVGVTTHQLKWWRLPQHKIGACQDCVSYYGKQSARLDLHHCQHYGVTFRFDGKRARRVLMDAAQYLAEIRRVEPKTTRPALPVRTPGFSKHAWSRVSVARWLYRREGPQRSRPPRTIEDYFGDIITQPSGYQSFVADYGQAYGKDNERQVGNTGSRHRRMPTH